MGEDKRLLLQSNLLVLPPPALCPAPPRPTPHTLPNHTTTTPTDHITLQPYTHKSKSICNKFPQPSPITCMSWPEARPNEVVFGLAEGKVKIGQLKSNKPATLYNVDTFCAALATSPDGNGVVSAHADGTLYRFLFDDNGASFVSVAFFFSIVFCIFRRVI